MQLHLLFVMSKGLKFVRNILLAETGTKRTRVRRNESLIVVIKFGP